MLIIPSIDIYNGMVVRLYQGEINKMTVYSDNPVEVAGKWQKLGAKLIHVIDLNGALYNQKTQLPLIKKIISKAKILIQVGGGIRTLKKAKEILAYGAERIILSTLAWQSKNKLKQLIELFPNRIIVAIDSRIGKTVVSGWKQNIRESPENLIKTYKTLGVKTFIYTDTVKDGTLHSPTFPDIKKVLAIPDVKIYLSGGFAKYADIKKAQLLGAEGVIIGKALYENKLDYSKLTEIADEN